MRARPGPRVPANRARSDCVLRVQRRKRVNAIRGLHEIGPEATPAVPAFLDAAKSGDLTIATWAVEALVRKGGLRPRND